VVQCELTQEAEIEALIDVEEVNPYKPYKKEVKAIFPNGLSSEDYVLYKWRKVKGPRLEI